VRASTHNAVTGESFLFSVMNIARPFRFLIAGLVLANAQAVHGIDGDASQAQIAAAAAGRSFFRANDFENAARNLQLETSLAEKSAQPPSEESLQMLAQCYARLGDVTGQTWALERLVTHYPRPRYWSELITRTQRRQDFAQRLALDFLRLRRATGSLQGADDYAALATLAMRAGFPAEAAAAVDAGFSHGVLGAGTDAARFHGLHDTAARQAADRHRAIEDPQAIQDAASQPTGEALIQLGYEFVTYGEYAKGLPLIQTGLRKGGIDKPSDAVMRLGMAYLLAGRKADALTTLATVTGVHGAADLGHLWYLHALGNAM